MGDTVQAPDRITDFAATRLGVVMSPRDDEPEEAWGVSNPAGVMAYDYGAADRLIAAARATVPRTLPARATSAR